MESAGELHEGEEEPEYSFDFLFGGDDERAVLDISIVCHFSGSHSLILTPRHTPRVLTH